MFDNVSKKLKILVFAFLGLGGAISLGGLLTGILSRNAVGAIAMFLGGAVVALCSFVVYGFAESLETQKEIAFKLEQIHLAVDPEYKKNAAARAYAPVPEAPMMNAVPQQPARMRREASRQARPVQQVPSSVRFCIHCGTMAQVGQNVCGKCGMPLNDQPVPATQPIVSAPVQQAPVQQAPVQQAPVQPAPAPEAPAQAAPVQQAPAQPAPTQTTPAAAPNTWRCKQCGALIENDRDVCWQCGSLKPVD